MVVDRYNVVVSHDFGKWYFMEWNKMKQNGINLSPMKFLGRGNKLNHNLCQFQYLVP
jgi:hypothetical protein